MHKTLLKAAAERARTWLFERALPLWLSVGFDRETGMFTERIDEDGCALPLDRRLRVQARQTYVCAEAAALGWQGDWRSPLDAGVKTLTGAGRRADGAFVHLFDPEGRVMDARTDLYDHAFGLFALAKAAAILKRPDLVVEVQTGWRWLDTNWGHPAGGYREGEIVSTEVRRQNPHMHLFEAALALHETDPAAGGLERAAGFAALFRDRFFDAEHGALPEYFDDGWSRSPGHAGRVTEPGHQFEWAWLLRKYAAISGDSGVRPIASRLIEHGRRYGIDPGRGVAINEVWIDGAVKDAAARLWPQTERLKAAVSGLNLDPEGEALEVKAALDGLFLFLDQPVDGAWRDVLSPDGVLIEEASPASSLYHITCAVGELVRAVDALEIHG